MTPRRAKAGETPDLGYDVPEFEDHDPSRKPEFHARKVTDEDQLEVVVGRRPSSMLCVNTLREAVDEWRDDGYPGASTTTQDLFRWWFEEASEGSMNGFRPYWAQRETVETIVYLIEVAHVWDARDLVETFGRLDAESLLDELKFQTTVDGDRQLLVPGRGAPMPLPPEDLPRYACKAATGSGKTMTMALLIVWSYFHAKRERESPMAASFLVLAPNVIVFERLKVDFEDARVFREKDLVPPGWSFDVRVIMRGDGTEPAAAGNLFVTNIQQLYESRSDWTPANAIDALLGRKPTGSATQSRSILERVRSVDRLLVLNDEAHHVHDDELEWNKTLLDLHRRLPGGLAAWLDFSATPKFQTGAYFPWIVSDYPLAQAVEDGIVKTPMILQMVDKANPTGVTAKNAVDKYGDWVTAGVQRLREFEKAYRDVPGVKPVMFLMCESVQHADALGSWLRDRSSGFKFKPEEILVIHTDRLGEVKKAELDELRRQARDIDDPTSPVKVVVSVLVLREGWDVRNVNIVLGLRPGTAEAKILPEQAVGRGLRLLPQVPRGQRQVLEVMGTPAFEDFVRALEEEGVYIKTTKNTPDPGIKIAPVREKLAHDIAIPRTGPILRREYRNIDAFDPLAASACMGADEVARLKAIRLRVQEATTGVEVGEILVEGRRPALASEIVSAITQRAQDAAHITGDFAELVPKVRLYLERRCFDETIDLESMPIRIFLTDPARQERVAGHLGRVLGELTAESQPLTIEPAPIHLSQTSPFIWRRKHTTADKTIFNFVATYNPFETEFADFLEQASDVKSFAALAEHFTVFGVDYLKPTGALGKYYPDWVVVQKTRPKAFWIIETKGRVWEGTDAKDAAIRRWCEQVSDLSGQQWSYMRVDQPWWNQNSFARLADLAAAMEDREMALPEQVLFRPDSG